LEFIVPRSGQSAQEGRFHEEKENAILKTMAPTHPSRNYLSADLLFSNIAVRTQISYLPYKTRTAENF
jgi:hypothetical protein